MAKKIRWGILSTAKIGIQKVIPAIQQAENCEVVAISSRNLEKAKSAAEKLGIPEYFDSYEAILNHPEIDAIYNPLPNHLHVLHPYVDMALGLQYTLRTQMEKMTSAKFERVVRTESSSSSLFNLVCCKTQN